MYTYQYVRGAGGSWGVLGWGVSTYICIFMCIGIMYNELDSSCFTRENLTTWQWFARQSYLRLCVKTNAGGDTQMATFRGLAYKRKSRVHRGVQVWLIGCIHSFCSPQCPQHGFLRLLVQFRISLRSTVMDGHTDWRLADMLQAFSSQTQSRRFFLFQMCRKPQ